MAVSIDGLDNRFYPRVNVLCKQIYIDYVHGWICAAEWVSV